MLFAPDDLLSRLPIEVNACQHLVSPFDDATHCVYKLRTTQGDFALKLLRETASPFWRGMDALFDVKLAQQVIRSPEHYACAAHYVNLTIPPLIASDSACASLPAYLLTRWLDDEIIDSAHIPLTLIESLAYSDAQRHQNKRTTWGSCLEPRHLAADWPERIHELLPELDRESLIPLANLDDFVPMIMDMRWDQCLQQQGRISALVDVDALVFAPKALELVLMEYWLTPIQLGIWRQAYLACGGELPTLRDVRMTYRQLLWPWHILGRLTQAQWMNWPHFFA